MVLYFMSLGGLLIIALTNWLHARKIWRRMDGFIDALDARLLRMEARMEKSIADSRAQSERYIAEIYATKKEVAEVQARIDEQGRVILDYHKQIMAAMKGDLH